MFEVYVKIDNKRRIVDVDTFAAPPESGDWFFVDEGRSYRYALAQGNYFRLPLMDYRFVWQYALDENNKPYKRTDEEMDADYAEMQEPTQEERLAALEAENAYLKEALELLLSGATAEEGEADG